jgi:hypothetical protein
MRRIEAVEGSRVRVELVAQNDHQVSNAGRVCHQEAFEGECCRKDASDFLM